ncbi:MAG TPA: hypothetical protein VHV74_26130 [Pseudonocardiaceae bacterium]|jgi:hypothetical protein|nr:hypothetical protein [Pseudonocardiaceae bacterium]
MPYHVDPSRGAIVTYVDDGTVGASVFRRAVAVGPAVRDPQTEDPWLPVLRTDSVVTMVEVASVVDVLPDGTRARAEDADDVVEVTRRALTALSRGLTEPATASLDHARTVLDDFVAAIDPVQSTLDVLSTVDPSGSLAVAVLYLIGARAHLENGDVTSTRAAIDAAQVVMCGLSPSVPRERPDPT